MNVLHGIAAPSGKGMVVEVHLDVMEAPSEFLAWICALGFEDDPFADFYPPEYRFHYTGRTRIERSSLRAQLPAVQKVTQDIIREAQRRSVGMYAETELVRRIHHFDDSVQSRAFSALEPLTFMEDPQTTSPRADIHVEFRSGTVTPETRSFFQAKNFYWVRTPATNRFPSEEIATLQTSTFTEARQVFHRLLAYPPPACTGVHLEQKLAMTSSFPDLPLPSVYTLRQCP